MGTTRRSSRPRREFSPAHSDGKAHSPANNHEPDVDSWISFIFKLAIITLVTLWIYSPAYHGDWLWDDDQAITANAVTQGPWSFQNIWVAPPGADYFPLTATGFWLPWQVFGPRPDMPPPVAQQAMETVKTAYHVMNVVFHILGALAFWRLLHVMRLPGAWLGGLLFAIHPVCIESVAWVSELKNTLSQPLFLLACASFVQFDEADDRAKATWHYALAVVFFLLAMFAKTSIVTFPFIILAYGWWKHGFPLNRDDAVAILIAVATAALAYMTRSRPVILVLLMLPALGMCYWSWLRASRGVRTLLFVGASLSLTAVPEMYWLVQLRNDQSSWPLYLRCAAVAVMGPLSSLALAAWFLKPSGSESVSGRKPLETYLFYALGVQAILLAVASLLLASLPESYWLAIREFVLGGWPSLWLLYLSCILIALFVPLASLVLTAVFLKASVAESGSGERALERYVFYSLAFFWIAVFLGIATCYFQWSRAIGQEAIPVGGILSRIATAGMATLFYLWKTVWPFDLLTIYPRWEVDPPKLWQFLPWPIMFAAGWWLWSNRGTADKPTWQRHAIFVLAFFLLMLLPIIGIITISYMRITWVADHFLYAPMVSVLGLAAAGVAAWFAKLKEGEKPVALAAGVAIIAVLGFSSFRYAHVWANEEALWPHTIAGHPNPCHEGCGCWQAHNRLGAKKFARGNVDEAHYHFQNSTRLRPDLGETHNNLGTTLSARAQMLAQRGDQAGAKREMDAAIEQFAEACRVTPHVPAIRVNLANALAAAGRFGEAGDKYKELLENEPNNPALINNYGVALYKQGLKEASIAQFRRALELAPNLKDAKESLAVALGEKPDPAESAPKPPPPGGRLNLETPFSPTLNAAPVLP